AFAKARFVPYLRFTSLCAPAPVQRAGLFPCVHQPPPLDLGRRVPRFLARCLEPRRQYSPAQVGADLFSDGVAEWLTFRLLVRNGESGASFRIKLSKQREYDRLGFLRLLGR